MARVVESTLESSRRATVIIEQPTEPRASADAADISFPDSGALDQFVLNPLVIALTVAVLDVLGNRAAKMAERSPFRRADYAGRPSQAPVARLWRRTGMYLRQVTKIGVLGLLGYVLFASGYLSMLGPNSSLRSSSRPSPTVQTST